MDSALEAHCAFAQISQRTSRNYLGFCGVPAQVVFDLQQEVFVDVTYSAISHINLPFPVPRRPPPPFLEATETNTVARFHRSDRFGFDRL